MPTRRQTGKGRRMERKGGEKDPLTEPAEERWLQWAQSHPAHRHREEKGRTTVTPPNTQLTKDCTTCSILPRTRQMPLTDSYSGAKKRILWVGQARGEKYPHLYKSTLTSSVSSFFKGRAGEDPQCLSSKQHHITSLSESWVMAYFHCFYLVLFFFALHCWFDTQRLCQEKYHFIVHLQGFLVYWI